MKGKESTDANKDGLMRITKITQYVKKSIGSLQQQTKSEHPTGNLEGDFAVTMAR
jgi:hypothetical protein